MAKSQAHSGGSDQAPSGSRIHKLHRRESPAPHPLNGGTVAALCAILLAALLIRAPFIGAGMPYLYEEDEAHHFNRIVQMTQSGDLNPHYFHKPSLHFYLRIPVVAASFLWGVRDGHLKSIKEVRTKDPFGLARYSFTASHPGIVKWNRAFSVALSVGVVFLSFLIARALFGAAWAGLLAAALTALSPALVDDSAKIGVDVVMTFFCTLSIYLALTLEKSYSRTLLFWSGICAGLAISSKYNALPIFILPLSAVLLARIYRADAILIAIVTPALGFIAGSPYILTEVPVFLDQLAYEVWHYGVAGHTGHSAEPGIAQSFFYLSWMAKDALGIVALVSSAVGLWVALHRNWRLAVTAGVFPLLFFALMAFQRTNFTRNMLVIIPILAVFAAGAIVRARTFKWGLPLVSAAILAQPLYLSAAHSISVARGIPESRREALVWLEQRYAPGTEIALSGRLQFPPHLYKRPGMTAVDDRSLDVASLFLQGFNNIVVGPEFHPSTVDAAFLKPEMEFAGESAHQRIVKNPAIRAFSIAAPPEAAELLEPLLSEEPFFKVFPRYSGEKVDVTEEEEHICYEDSEASTEGYCWIRLRVSELILPHLVLTDGESEVKLALRVMSPWPEQVIRFPKLPGNPVFTLTHTGRWEEIEVSVPRAMLEQSRSLRIEVEKVRSPKAQGVSGDDRRLGLAVERVQATSTMREET